MLTEKEYIEHQYDDEYKEARIEYNKYLLEKYPWLGYRDWDIDADTYRISENEDYTSTWLDALPDGWRLSFGLQMVEEIDEELRKHDFVDKYSIMQVKEKFGGLRWYTGGVPINSKLYEIEHKYEDLSFEVCIKCGKPVKYSTKGYIIYVCEDCKNDMIKKDDYLTEECFEEIEAL